jgi:MFS family permease
MIIPLMCQLESPTHFLSVRTICFYSTTLLSSKNHTGAIIGQVIVGLICDRIGRKAALVITTALIVLGATLATAAHGAGGSAAGLFWFLTVAR